jgi:carboxymethylenebutenolidase
MILRTPEGEAAPANATRRTALASIFTAGYALATGPANAQAITTDDEGLVVQDVMFPAHDGYGMPGYLARPKARGRKPAVLVVNEIFGIHAYIKDVCRRLAKQGYVALAPDYFDRAGDPSTLEDFGAIREIVAQARYDQVMGDTDAAARFLRSRRYVAGTRMGMTGFCWGGGVVWMAASRSRAFRAGVAWYGRLTAPEAGGFGAESERQWPVEVAGKLMWPVLGLYGSEDRGIPVESVEAMRAAFAASGNPSGSEIVLYQGAQHGFHADYRPSYDKVAAEDGWRRLTDWFARHGVA